MAIKVTIVEIVTLYSIHQGWLVVLVENLVVADLKILLTSRIESLHLDLSLHLGLPLHLGLSL